jgi:hypothetical protein
VQYSLGSSTIVDSGTTETSLPVSMGTAFQDAFKLATQDAYGAYSDKEYMNQLSREQLSGLPDVVFVFANGIEQRMPAADYIDCDAKTEHGDKVRCLDRPWHAKRQNPFTAVLLYASCVVNGIDCRVTNLWSFTCVHQVGCVGGIQFEGKGTVLGANFMRNKDVVFDNRLVRNLGFTRS